MHANMPPPLSLDVLFSIVNTGVLPFWLVLAFAPFRWPLVRPVVIAVAVLLAMVYAALFGVYFGSGTGNFNSLGGVAQLFSNPGLLLAGWVHYLAFDLLVGTWEREEAARIGIHRVWLVVCLFLTLMAGPLGWLLFMAVRSHRLRVLAHEGDSTSGKA
jgi:hypothetical protein